MTDQSQNATNPPDNKEEGKELLGNDNFDSSKVVQIEMPNIEVDKAIDASTEKADVATTEIPAGLTVPKAKGVSFGEPEVIDAAKDQEPEKTAEELAKEEAAKKAKRAL